MGSTLLAQTGRLEPSSFLDGDVCSHPQGKSKDKIRPMRETSLKTSNISCDVSFLDENEISEKVDEDRATQDRSLPVEGESDGEDATSNSSGSDTVGDTDSETPRNSSCDPPNPTAKRTHEIERGVDPHDEEEAQAQHASERAQENLVNQSTRVDNGNDIDDEGETINFIFAHIAIGAEPIDYRDAVSGEAVASWRSAMQDEWATLAKLKVFHLVKLPLGRKAIGCKWVFKLKLGANSEVTKHKARLVAQGFMQKYMINYTAIHAPVVHTSVFKLLASLAAILSLRPHQLDVKAAFLNGKLEEVLYMKQPPGFIVKGKEEYVLKLLRSIYSLKQSGRVWNKTFDHDLKAHSKSILGLHVDDLTLFVNSDNQVTRLIDNMSGKEIELIHLGPLNFMLGICFTWDAKASTVTLDQRTFIKTILEHFRFTDVVAASTPLVHGTILSRKDCPTTEEEKAEMKHVPYSALVGCILYLVIWSRPDLAHTAMALSQFSANPGNAHWTAAKHVLRYLAGTKDYGLVLGGKGDNIMGAVTWQSKKQQTVSLSSAKLEYMALVAATQEALWIRHVLAELGFEQSTPMVIHSDNLAAITLTSNSVLHAHIKHIDICHHFIHDHVECGDIEAKYIPMGDQPVDALTKALPKRAHTKHCATLGLYRT
ncbi:hypothetical protein M0805_000584 [Coniferiporia weirii]|nr:hypothetical protein M0805_000584 [Coniferiporia weirii]